MITDYREALSEAVGNWRFDYLNGSHLKSQVKSGCQMMVFMPQVQPWFIGLIHTFIAFGCKEQHGWRTTNWNTVLDFRINSLVAGKDALFISHRNKSGFV